MDLSKIVEKIDYYKNQQQEVIKKANEQITALGGAVAVLEELLRELTEADQVSSAGNPNPEGDN